MPIRGGNLKPQVGKEMNAQENESSVIYLKLKKTDTNKLLGFATQEVSFTFHIWRPFNCFDQCVGSINDFPKVTL